jgi:hypothetical protein
MTWEIFYLACFSLGLVLCVLSVFTGGHLHTGHFHVGHFHLGHTHVGHHHTGASVINGFTITAFLCWFGGVGYLLRTHSSFLASLVLLFSSLSGIAGGSLIFWFMATVLLRREHALTAQETQVEGVIGRLTSSLQPGATGEIIYSQLGARRSAPARSEDGITIDRGSEVVVLRYEHGIAYVRSLHDLDL